MRQITACTLLLATLAAGCLGADRREVYDEHRVALQHEAGSVHFAVLSVAPWEYYVDALQPRFSLTEDQALGAVVPATRAVEDALIDIAKAKAGIERTGSSVSPGGSDPLPDSTGVDLVANRPVRNAQTSPPLSGADVSLDPMTRYWAATAFYQEVQLLSRYVRDAAVRDGFRPYLVRLQVSLLPSARNEPYDAYCTLSFFATDGAAAGPTIRSPLKGADRGDGSKRRVALPAISTQLATERGSTQVLPLMVTDNLEASVQSSMVQTVRQLAAALNVLSSTASGGVGAESTESSFQQVLGSDLNSLLTVARVSDNTVRVRLGAMQQASAKYAMVPRNHNITLLLMVPDGAEPTVRVVSKTTLVDAETGYELPDRDPGEVDRALERVMESHEIEGVPARSLRPLVASAQANDQRAFDRAFERLFAADPELAAYKDVLWLDLVSLMVGGRYGAAEFDLPPYDPTADRGTELIPPQTAFVVRGPGDSALATLDTGNQALDARAWRAALEVRRPTGDVFVVPGSGVFVDPLTGQVTCAFPPHPLSFLTDSPDGEVTLILRDKSQERRFGAHWNQ